MTEQADADLSPAHDGDAPHENALQAMASRHRLRAAEERAAFEAALRVAFGRMAADCPGLDGVVQQVATRHAALTEVLDLIEPGGFISVLEGPGEAMGLIVTCATVMAGMIEAQTTGRVAPLPSAKRKPTRTDAALMAPMIDAFLRRIEQRCVELPQAELVRGYVYGSYLDDPRPLGLMLEDGVFHVLHLRVSLGFGAKEGDWYLFLPDPQPLQTDAEKAAPVVDEAQEWEDRLQAAISSSEVVVTAMLGRLQITLTDALRLRPGDVLRVPEAALEALMLETITHEPIGIGRLGQARGQRAVRLTADPGVLTDTMGATARQPALPAQIIPFAAPQAAFVPDADLPRSGQETSVAEADRAQHPVASEDSQTSAS